MAPYAQMLLAAFRGQRDALPLIESTIRDAGTSGQGLGVQWAEWVSAILFNGLGRYDRALAAAERAAEETSQLHVLPLGIDRADRSGGPHRETRRRGRCTRAGDGGHRALRHRLGPGNPSALPGTLERG